MQNWPDPSLEVVLEIAAPPLTCSCTQESGSCALPRQHSGAVAGVRVSQPEGVSVGVLAPPLICREVAWVQG